MADYKSVKDLTREEAAYLAGLVDGEGTITLTKRQSNTQRTAVISIANTELSILEYTLRIVGAGTISSKRTFKSGHTPSFAYQISGRQAIRVIEQITPFLRSYKRERAMLILKNYINLTPRNGRYTSALLKQKECFIKEFFSIVSNKNDPHQRVIL